MYSKIKKLVLDVLIPAARDIRVVSLVVLGVLAVLTTWNGVQLIDLNYKLQQEISELEAKNKITKLENDNLRLKSEYLKTDTYLELVARSQFSKGAAGEELILIPKEVALSYAPNLPDQEMDVEIKAEESGYMANLRAWRDFYFPN